MDKKKPIGYTNEQTKSLKTLIERTQKDTGDYVGSGTVTEVPKKKKKMKRMMDGGMARPVIPAGPAIPLRGRQVMSRGDMMNAAKDRIKNQMGMMPRGSMTRPGMMAGAPVKLAGMKGGGLARKGVGMALAKGGLVSANGCAKRGKTRGKMV